MGVEIVRGDVRRRGRDIEDDQGGGDEHRDKRRSHQAERLKEQRRRRRALHGVRDTLGVNM